MVVTGQWLIVTRRWTLDVALERKNMSGGSFDYAFTHVEHFARELEEYLSQEVTQPDDCYVPYESPSTRDVLQTIVHEMRAVANIMYAVEWLYSGDIGEKAFLDHVARARMSDEAPHD